MNKFSPPNGLVNGLSYSEWKVKQENKEVSGVPPLGGSEAEWQVAMDYLFKTYTRSHERNGVFYIKCKKNLWGVSGTDWDYVNTEAKRYFIQYLQDGEYNEPNL